LKCVVYAKHDCGVCTCEQELFEICTEFAKLEKMEFGGMKGKLLSALAVQIFDEFKNISKVFAERTYDCLDTTEKVRNGVLFKTLLLLVIPAAVAALLVFIFILILILLKLVTDVGYAIAINFCSMVLFFI
jgi:hypothetical protein